MTPKEIGITPGRASEKSIYIIGPRRLQNELMAFYLEKETGLRCFTGENLHHIQAEDGKGMAQGRLILLDCLDEDPDSYLAALERDGKRILDQDLVAFLNLRHGAGFEERAVGRRVRGFFYEGDQIAQFLKGIKAILGGELWVSREILTEHILHTRGVDRVSGKEEKGLTAREVEILAMISLGARNEEIAEELFISPSTVKTHIYHIFKKIDVPNRLQAALWAVKNL